MTILGIYVCLGERSRILICFFWALFMSWTKVIREDYKGTATILFLVSCYKIVKEI